ncbi:hypothetical protein GCM10022260_15940 [Gaetbulibacter aestuarii]
MYLNIDIKDNNAEAKNKPKYKKLSCAYTKTPFSAVHKGNTNMSPADIPAAIKRYMVCMR